MGCHTLPCLAVCTIPETLCAPSCPAPGLRHETYTSKQLYPPHTTRSLPAFPSPLARRRALAADTQGIRSLVDVVLRYEQRSDAALIKLLGRRCLLLVAVGAVGLLLWAVCARRHALCLEAASFKSS